MAVCFHERITVATVVSIALSLVGIALLEHQQLPKIVGDDRCAADLLCAFAHGKTSVVYFNQHPAVQDVRVVSASILFHRGLDILPCDR